MKSKVSLKIRSTNFKNQQISTLTIKFNSGIFTLELFCEDETHLISKHKFPFMALINIRESLEKMDKFLLCNGSRYDVYPSGMSAIGNKAYILELGKPGIKLVNIFKPCSKNIDLVQKQKEYREDWLKSLKEL